MERGEWTPTWAGSGNSHRSAPLTCSGTHTHPEQWAANAAAPVEQLGVWCLAQGSHLSHGIEGGESAGYSPPETQTHDLWVTSPTLYPLGHDCPPKQEQMLVLQNGRCPVAKPERVNLLFWDHSHSTDSRGACSESEMSRWVCCDKYCCSVVVFLCLYCCGFCQAWPTSLNGVDELNAKRQHCLCVCLLSVHLRVQDALCTQSVFHTEKHTRAVWHIRLWNGRKTANRWSMTNTSEMCLGC